MFDFLELCGAVVVGILVAENSEKILKRIYPGEKAPEHVYRDVNVERKDTEEK